MGNVDGCVGDGVFNYSFAQQGWQCPICKRIYAPHVDICYYCGDQTVVSTDTKYKYYPMSSYKDFIQQTNNGNQR